uniref:Protein-tyrosine-phosphatase n=1 Tax=Cuerna arida TaxID=1464854 RepID=A0A1B6F6L0_9HEMI
MKILTNFATKEVPEDHNNNDTAPPSTLTDTSKLFSVSPVTPALFLSGAPAVREDVLISLGVSCVISAAPELPPPPLPPQVSLVLRLPLKDQPTEDLLSQLHTVSDTIHQVIQDGGCVLVHCLAGVSRSAALVLAYLVKHRDLTLRSAFLHLRACRPAVRPNSGFFRQLIEFENQTRGTTSVEMVFNPAARTHIPDLYEADYQNTLCFINNRNFGKH